MSRKQDFIKIIKSENTVAIIILVISFVFAVAGPWLVVKIHDLQIKDYCANAAEYVAKCTEIDINPKGVLTSKLYLTYINEKVNIPALKFAHYTTAGIAVICIILELLRKKYKYHENTTLAAIIFITICGCFKSMVETMLITTWKNVLVIAIIVILVYLLMRKSIGFEELLLIFVVLWAVIPGVMMIFWDGVEPKIEPNFEKITTYPGIDPSLLEGILAVTRSGDVSDDCVFINKTPEINASAGAGAFYKFVVICAGMLDACGHDEVICVMYHELGHIINNDVIKGGFYLIAFVIVFIVLLVVVYRCSKRYISRAVAAILVLNLSQLITILCRVFFFNVVISQPQEYNADLNAYKAGYAEADIRYSKIYINAISGILFEFNSWYRWVTTHPSAYNRILAAKKYIADNS